MGLNIRKGNMYKFVTHTWNTVKGECQHDCSYCYMKRFGEQNPVRFDENEIKTVLGKAKFIFVGSSNDMFAFGIPEEWILRTLDHCAQFENKYLFQTKNPRKFLEFISSPAINERTGLCTTIETNRWYPEIMGNSPKPLERALAMIEVSKSIKTLVTIEPIMDFDLSELVELIRMCNPVQVNIGADSGNNNLPEPTKEKVLALIEELKLFTKVELKENIFRIL
ncbi:MAG: hypothetical protein HQ521_07795 [Bacteroidetes bacterium]|nr:hypothetical protein [Bacteroidota bacterium]